MAQVPSLIFLPTTTPKQKIDKLHSLGAKTSVTGEVWDESNEAALQAAKKNKIRENEKIKGKIKDNQRKSKKIIGNKRKSKGNQRSQKKSKEI